jgi:uncharacterized protein (TIGR02996 family)
MTGDALLRAIANNPLEDLPRLVYADWCDENDRPEHAEFIRVQCKLSNPEPTLQYLATEAQRELGNGSLDYLSEKAYRIARRRQKAATKRRIELSLREQALIEQLRQQLCPVCCVCDGAGAIWPSPLPIRVCEHCHGHQYIGEIRRGFLESVTVPREDILFYLRVQAPRKPTPVGVSYRLTETWSPTKWAKDLLAKFPTLQQLKFPIPTRNNGCEVWSRDFPATDVSDQIWGAMKSPVSVEEGERFREYETPELTAADLGQATITILREMIAAEKADEARA